MAFDIEAAKADGYTDEEIQAYLASRGMATPESQPGSQPVPTIPQNAPIDRSEEQTALMQGMGAEALKYGAGAAAAGYGLKKVGDIVRGPVTPATPVPPGATQRTMGSLIGGANTMTVPAGAQTAPMPTPAAAPAAAEATQMSAARSIVQKLALDKVLKGAGAAGGLAALGAGLFYTSPEEIAILKQAEARKKAGMR